ncbi:MAG: LamG-like jellyroll fold domain-containing protein [Candidatus Brocadiia bacterium]
MRRARSLAAAGPARGFTLVELLVAMGLIVLLLLVGVGLYYRINRGFALRAAVSGIESALRGARAFAVHERGRTVVVLEPEPQGAFDPPVERIYALGKRTVSYWHFESEQFEGTTLAGALGQEGTLEGGATHAPGKIGDALLLDGSSAHVSVQSPYLDQIREGVTAEAYVRPDPLDLSAGAVLPVASKRADGGSQAFALALRYSPSDTQDLFRLEGSVTTENGAIQDHTAAVVHAGRWTHVGLAYDREGPGIVLTVDGRELELAAGATGSGRLVPNTAPLRIGRDGADHFQGRIDELKVAALVAGEVYEFPKNTEVRVDTGTVDGLRPGVYFDDQGKLDPRAHGRIVRFRVESRTDQLRRVVQVNWLGGVEVLERERDVDETPDAD